MTTQTLAHAPTREILAQTVKLRTSPVYREAERLRHRTSAASMAKAAQGSDKYEAVRLLIDTWNEIAVRARASGIPCNQLFEVTPVGLSWKNLGAAVMSLRDDGHVNEDYAGDFESLADEYDAWLKGPAGRRFRTEADQAIIAMFL
jgi:hypothetical protein